MKERKKIIEVKNLSFYYTPADRILNNISFDLMEGEFAGLIGPNGAGKTTLLKILMGFLKPLEGSVKLFGVPIEKFKDWHLVGYVPQKSSFERSFPGTVKEIVSLGILSQKGLGSRLSEDDKKRINAMLFDMGIKELENKRITELSGGQLQRVLLAKALIKKPKLIILDEPLIGIDAAQQEKFCCLLSRLNRDLGVSILTVSHDLSLIAVHATKILCLNRVLHYCGSLSKLDEESIRKTFGHAVRLIKHKHGGAPVC